MNDISKKQEILTQNLEGLGDILVYQTRRKKNKNVIQGMLRIKTIHDRLFDIKRNKPERFKRLLMSQRYFEMREESKEAADFEVAFRPKDHLIAFYATINQFMRIYEMALKVNNDEISAEAIYYLTLILSDLVTQPDNEQFIRQILNEFNNLFESNSSLRQKDYATNALAYRWYTTIIYSESKPLRPEYLAILNDALLLSLVTIIQNDYNLMFNWLLSALIDNVFAHHNVSTWTLHETMMRLDFAKYNEVVDSENIRTKTSDLENRLRKISTYTQLKNWIDDLDNLTEVLSRALQDDTAKDKFDKTVDELKDRAVTSYKRNALTALFFDVGARCLFYKKYSFIYDLWEYNQPTDSIATWGSDDLYYTQPDQLVNYYFGDINLDEDYIGWPGHHGNELYYKRYFLLLLARNLGRSPGTVAGLHINDVTKLQSITYAVPELLSVAQDLQRDEELLSDLHIAENTFMEYVVPTLQAILGSANDKLSQIENDRVLSQEKVKGFKTYLEEGYTSTEVFATLFQEFGLYKELVIKRGQTIKRRFTLPRNAFIDGWNTLPGPAGVQFGQQVAIDKNEALLENFLSRATDGGVDINLTTEFLGKLRKPVILAYGLRGLQYFNRTTEPLSNEENKKLLGADRYLGWYTYGRKKLPVLLLPLVNNDRPSFFLIIDMASPKSIGTYTQSEEFSIAEHDLASDSDMVEEILASNSFNEDNIESQREKLRKGIVFETSEKFSLRLSKSPTIIKVQF